NYAYNMREWSEHQLLHERLSSTRCQWILSSYDTPEIRAMYGDYFILPVQSSSGMKVEKNRSTRVINREVLITNFAPPNKLLLVQPDAQQNMVLFEAVAEYNVSDQAKHPNGGSPS